MGAGIECIGDGVYLVYQHVIWVKDNAIDVSTECGRQRLIEHATETWSHPMHPVPYGALTCDVISPWNGHRDDADCLVAAIHFGYLPDPVKDILRLKFPAYADEI